MGDQLSRKPIATTLDRNNVAKLKELAKVSGQPQTRILDQAVDELYEKEMKVMESEPKHKGIVITVANNKGGVGKTTTTAAFAHLISKRGKNVLLIDADPQGNLSNRFGFSIDDLRDNYLGALINDCIDNGYDDLDIEKYICHSSEFPRVDIIVSDIRLDNEYKKLLISSPHNSIFFKKVIEKARSLDKYDYILMDVRPALSNEVGASVIGTDYIIVPMEAAMDSIIGANSIISFMVTNRYANDNVKLLGVFFNKVKDRTTAFHKLLPFVKEGGLENYLFETKIPHAQDVVNAENSNAPVTYKYPNCKASKAYVKLLDEVVNRLETI